MKVKGGEGGVGRGRGGEGGREKIQKGYWIGHNEWGGYGEKMEREGM